MCRVGTLKAEVACLCGGWFQQERFIRASRLAKSSMAIGHSTCCLFLAQASQIGWLLTLGELQDKQQRAWKSTWCSGTVGTTRSTSPSSRDGSSSSGTAPSALQSQEPARTASPASWLKPFGSTLWSAATPNASTQGTDPPHGHTNYRRHHYFLLLVPAVLSCIP